MWTSTLMRFSFHFAWKNTNCMRVCARALTKALSTTDRPIRQNWNETQKNTRNSSFVFEHKHLKFSEMKRMKNAHVRTHSHSIATSVFIELQMTKMNCRNSSASHFVVTKTNKTIKRYERRRKCLEKEKRAIIECQPRENYMHWLEINWFYCRVFLRLFGSVTLCALFFCILLFSTKKNSSIICFIDILLMVIKCQNWSSGCDADDGTQSNIQMAKCKWISSSCVCKHLSWGD